VQIAKAAGPAALKDHEFETVSMQGDGEIILDDPAGVEARTGIGRRIFAGCCSDVTGAAPAALPNKLFGEGTAMVNIGAGLLSGSGADFLLLTL